MAPNRRHFYSHHQSNINFILKPNFSFSLLSIMSKSRIGTHMKKIITLFLSLFILYCSSSPITTTSVAVKAVDESGNQFSFPPNTELRLIGKNSYSFIMNNDLVNILIEPGDYSIAIFIENELKSSIQLSGDSGLINAFLKDKNVTITNGDLNIVFITEKPVDLVNNSIDVTSTIVTSSYIPQNIEINCPLGVFENVKYTPLYDEVFGEIHFFGSKVGKLYFNITSDWSFAPGFISASVKTSYADSNGHELTSSVLALSNLTGAMNFYKSNNTNKLFVEATSTLANVNIAGLANNYVEVRLNADLGNNIIGDNVLRTSLLTEYTAATLDIYFYNGFQMLTSSNHNCSFRMIK